jgi:hypothetical protein
VLPRRKRQRNDRLASLAEDAEAEAIAIAAVQDHLLHLTNLAVLVDRHGLAPVSGLSGDP